MKTFQQLYKPYLTKEKIFIILTIFILINITIFTSYQQSFLSDPQYLKEFPVASLEFFYHLFRIGTNPFLFMLLMLLVPNLISYDVLHHQQTHMSYLIEVRTTKRKYYFDLYIKNIISTFIVTFFLIVCILFIVHFFYAPIQFQTIDFPENYYAVTQILSSHEVISLLSFILLTSLGYALISSLVLSLQIFISNKYIYRCCGVMFGILLVIVPALIQGFLLFPDLAFLLQINNLVALGMENVRINPFEMSHILLYTVSFLIYVCLSLAAFSFMIRWREHHD